MCNIWLQQNRMSAILICSFYFRPCATTSPMRIAIIHSVPPAFSLYFSFRKTSFFLWTDFLNAQNLHCSFMIKTVLFHLHCYCNRPIVKKQPCISIFTLIFVNTLLFTHHYPARCFGMNMPKSRDIQVKIPLPQAIWNEFWLRYCERSEQ